MIKFFAINFFIILLLGGCSTTVVKTERINENGQSILVMKPECLLTKREKQDNFLLGKDVGVSVGIHFECDQMGIIRGYVLVIFGQQDFLFCHPGDEISFALHDKMKIQRLTYVFTKEEEKKRFGFKTSETGFGGPILHKYMVFEIKYEDLKKIATTKNIVASIKCRGFERIENIMPERTRRTIVDFVEKIKK